MKRYSLLLTLAMSVLVFATADTAEAGRRARADRQAASQSERSSWHQPYYHTSWGRPIALIVPPTARTETNWGWGVTQSSVTPIYQQFKRPFPGDEPGEYNELHPTPPWPSHTHQFGVYYVRGPWQ